MRGAELRCPAVWGVERWRRGAAGRGGGTIQLRVRMNIQCFPFPGIGPEAESSPVTLRIKYGICPGISGIYPNPAAESNLG